MSTNAFNALISPVADCLDTPSLEALVNLRASPEAAARLDALAERANEGTLSADERSEYESCVMFTSFLGILQSQARQKLSNAA